MKEDTPYHIISLSSLRPTYFYYHLPTPAHSTHSNFIMAADDGGNIVWFTYTGAEGEQIPDEATHIFVTARIIRRRAFYEHPSIIEVICHDIVVNIGACAFWGCPFLRRVIMPGVENAESWAFYGCEALTDVECGRLEIIKGYAFSDCESLKCISLPSARIIGEWAFNQCRALTNVKLGNQLERFEQRAFYDCTSLQRISLPLKDGMITDDAIFEGCRSLKHVDLIDGEVHETIAALQLEEWRNDMNRKIDSINQILLDTPPGGWNEGGAWEQGEKAWAIRRWIKSVLDQIIYYQAEHHRILNREVASALELALPRDIATNNVLPFLELPSHTFEVEFEAINEDDLFIYDDDDQSDESRHRCCCLRKLWQSR